MNKVTSTSAILLALCSTMLIACVEVNSDEDTDTGTSSDMPVDSDVDTATETNIDTNADSESETTIDTDSDTSADSDSSTEMDTDTGDGTDADTGTGTDTDTGVSCDDQLDCTQDIATIDGNCMHIIDNGTCLIEGECYNNDEVDPANPCEICSPLDDQEAWTVTPGESCGFCLECTAEATCEKTPACCDVRDHSMNASPCGTFSPQQLLVKDGCIASFSTTTRTEYSTQTFGGGWACADGVWEVEGTGGAPATYASNNFGGAYSFSLNPASCDTTLPQITFTCDDVCPGDSLPLALRVGNCGSYNTGSTFRNGIALGIRRCGAGSETCEETSVSCQNKNWVELSVSSVAAPPEAETTFIDTWFYRLDGVEKTLSSSECATRTCQLASLQPTEPFAVYGYCGYIPAPKQTFLPTEEFTYSSSVSSPGSSGGGTTGIWECQTDGSWNRTNDGGGGGGPCPACDYSWTDNWKKNDISIHTLTCSNACNTSTAPNYSHLTYSAFGRTIPKARTFSRCVYADGVLSSSAISACSTVTDRAWISYGTDSTCPPTVQALNAMAEADSTITPCTGNNCVFWRTNWGNVTKTVTF